MRIQEMRSGFSRLRKKVEGEEIENFADIFATAETAVQPGEPVAAVQSELSEPRWAVISFERTESAGLTYAQAVHTMDELQTRRVSGLCIVTVETAAMVRS